ncbi:hypothetical protein [Spiroplasma taiwanense]|uniref:hypothetical protein n=1 Tax=Spiroplasma taiwanense TaxID=2145 RepID=UPI00040ECF87|nr:hypothetical protein [Spiroplasma taiwanense]
MKKYEKFSEIFNLYNSLNIYKNLMKDLKKEVNSAKSELHNKKVKLKEIKPIFNKIEKDKLKELNTSLNISLLNAKYSKTNINQLYEDFNNDKEKLKNEYIKKKQKRIEKTMSEIEMIKVKNKTLLQQWKEIKLKIKSTKIEIKDKWNSFENLRLTEEVKLKENLNITKKEVQKK